MSETEITRAFGSKCSFSFQLFLSGFAPQRHISRSDTRSAVRREALQFRGVYVRERDCVGTVIN